MTKEERAKVKLEAKLLAAEHMNRGTFGGRLRVLRVRAGLTLRSMAAAYNEWSSSYLALLEGDRGNPTLETIYKLAKVLNAEPAELFEGVKS